MEASRETCRVSKLERPPQHLCCILLCLRSRQGYFLNEHSGDHASFDMPGPRHNPKSLPLADNWSSISGALRFLIQSADLIPTCL